MVYNFGALDQEIDRIRKERGITQIKLAEYLGVKQARVSQALHNKKGSTFTLDQYILIADLFGMTLGELFSLIEKPKKTEALSVKDVCRMLADIYNSDLGFKFYSVDVTEAVYKKEVDDGITCYIPHSVKNGYLSIYFSKYFQVVNENNEEDIKATNFGNNSACGYINEFLVRLRELSEACDAGIIDRDSFDGQVKRYIKELPDISDEKIKIPVWLT